MFDAKNWNWSVEKDYNGNHFHDTDKKFLRYFVRDKNENESNKTELLFKRLKEFTEKIHSAGLTTDTTLSETRLCLQLGYTENYGYYALEDNGRGNYSVPYGLPSEDLDTAILMIIRCIIWYYSFEFERINRSELENDYKYRFGRYDLPYVKCLYYAEYCLCAWKVLLNNEVSKEVVEYYETYLNDILEIQITSYVWKFDVKHGRFILTLNTKR